MALPSSSRLLLLVLCVVIGASFLDLTRAKESDPNAEVICMQYADTPEAIPTQPHLSQPQDIAIDGMGDLFVVDSARRELIRIDAVTGESSVLMDQRHLEVPVGLTISPLHADLYVGDENTSTVWKLLCQTRNKNYCEEYHTTTPINMSLSSNVHPMGLQMDGNDHLFIADFAHSRVLRRDSTTGKEHTILSDSSINQNLTKPFGPHDIAINPDTHALYVTDKNNDLVFKLSCTPNGIDSTGLSCDTYSNNPVALSLEGSSSNIEMPSGVTLDLQGALFVTGMKKGIVAEIKDNASVDLLAGNSALPLKDPVSITFDQRPIGKDLYISDDQATNKSSTGLYRLNCTTKICAPLGPSIVKNAASLQCTLTHVGETCDFVCDEGYASPNVTTILCSEESGWVSDGIVCAEVGTFTTTNPDAQVSNDGTGVGVGIGVTLAVLALVGVGIWLFIKFKRNKQFIVKNVGDSDGINNYTTTFAEEDGGETL